MNTNTLLEVLDPTTVRHRGVPTGVLAAVVGVYFGVATIEKSSVVL